MYMKNVSFRFLPEIMPSARMAFLARLAKACESDAGKQTGHHHFTISMKRHEECSVAFMAPSVYQNGLAQLRAAQEEGILTVTDPDKT